MVLRPSVDDESELDDLLSLLDDLNLDPTRARAPLSSPAALSSPPRFSTSPQTSPALPPAPRRTHPSNSGSPTHLVQLAPSFVPDAHPRLYEFHSPSKSGLTRDWEVAAHYSQGSPGGSSRRLTPKKKKPHRGKGGYAVFVGGIPGAYRQWAAVEPLVNGVSGTVYQGYSMFDGAVAAFEYAVEHSWTRVAGPFATEFTPPAAIPRLPTPIAATIMGTSHNPLHDVGARHESWYIVYSGITPGVYQSYLECSLNTVGLRGAVHDSCTTRALADERYERALLAGRVKRFAAASRSLSFVSPTPRTPPRHPPARPRPLQLATPRCVRLFTCISAASGSHPLVSPAPRGPSPCPPPPAPRGARPPAPARSIPASLLEQVVPRDSHLVLLFLPRCTRGSTLT
ncbi:hypothetical protein C8R46DRAFT_1215470 [Mycena filopes]|nr:hypothetical protein C8R46DRAFT_1215470 [Mycena filopes]